MILSGVKIKKELERGNIFLDPFNNSMLNPNSYNYRLSEILLEITDQIIDPLVENKYKRIVIPEDGYLLKPGKLYLGSTYEKIGSSKYVPQLIGRSSLGRLGLFLQVTAPLGHIGCCHNWTLELKVVQPLRIYPKMRIGQMTFWKMEGEKVKSYEIGKYNKYTGPQISLYYKKGIYI